MRSERLRLGVEGLDDVLGGGVFPGRLYLLQGTPGVGKTTLALQFLLEGVRLGEPALYITLSETRDEILEVADSHGWSLDGIALYELSAAEQTLRLDAQSTMYATSDVELDETMRVLLTEVERVNPKRVVFDSLSEVRLLSQTAARYRRELLSLKQHFIGRGCTVLLVDDLTGGADDTQLQSLAHGVIALEQIPATYGADRRRLRIAKLRGASYRSGYHDFRIEKGGLRVFPRLVAAEHRTKYETHALPSGVAELDRLLGGGIDRGSATLIMGPAGTGKSAITMQLSCAAAARGERAALFLFEERIGTVRARATGLGMDLFRYVDEGLVTMQQIDPAEVAPDEFSQCVRDAIVKDAAKVVVIDSINGYFNAMPDARALVLQLHELLSYAGAHGVATVLTMAQTGLGASMSAPIDMSYLADTVLLLRYFEAGGRVRKAISVIKKRSGHHEDSIREMKLHRGVIVGEPLTHFHGVLTGVPEYRGPQGDLEDSEKATS